MYTFTLEELTHYHCKAKVFALGVNGSFLFKEFVSEIKDDHQLAPELGDLIPAIKYFADGKTPFLPNYRFKKLKLGKLPYSGYEAKSKHLRVYLFTDEEGVINILGGYKVDQTADLEKVKIILKEYHNQKLKQK
jgi:hypothetical protein